MKPAFRNSVKNIKNLQFCLLASLVSIIAIHLNLTWKFSEYSNSIITAFTGIIIVTFLWEKRSTLSLKSGIGSKITGILFIAYVLLISLFASNWSLTLQLSPFISAMGLALFASGVKGLKQYWQELILIFAIVISPELILPIIDLSSLTVNFVTFILFSLGFEVSCQGVILIFPTTTVTVTPDCSGLRTITHLVRFAILILVMFPTNLVKSFLIFITAILVGFIFNGGRVTFLSILWVHSNYKAFEYWHEGTGSHILKGITLFIWGVFCYFIIQTKFRKNAF